MKLLINKILKVLPTVIKKGIARTLSPTYTESGEEVQSKITYTPEELQYVITVLGEQTFKIKLDSLRVRVTDFDCLMQILRNSIKRLGLARTYRNNFTISHEILF